VVTASTRTPVGRIALTDHPSLKITHSTHGAGLTQRRRAIRIQTATRLHSAQGVAVNEEFVLPSFLPHWIERVSVKNEEKYEVAEFMQSLDVNKHGYTTENLSKFISDEHYLSLCYWLR